MSKLWSELDGGVGGSDGDEDSVDGDEDDGDKYGSYRSSSVAYFKHLIRMDLQLADILLMMLQTLKILALNKKNSHTFGLQEKRCFQLPSADLDSTTLEKCSTQLGAPKCRSFANIIVKHISAQNHLYHDK